MSHNKAKPISAKDFFDVRAESYHIVSRWATNEDLNIKTDDFLDGIFGKIAVDIGAGTGILISRLQNFETKIALDISEEMLSQIKDLSVAKVVGDVHQLMLIDGSVDLIICRQLLHYCDLATAFQNLKRVLSHHGLVHIVQVVDFERVPESWDQEWASFRNVCHRKHLRKAELESFYRNNSLGVIRREYLKLRDEYSWDDFYMKHNVSDDRRKEVMCFFEMTPESVAKEIDLRLDRAGIAYDRLFGFWLLKSV